MTTAGPALDLDDIQGIILSGYAHLDHMRIMLLAVEDPVAARQWLARIIPLISTARARTRGEAKPNERANIAITAAGLKALGLDDDEMATFPREFVMDMAAPERSRKLGDTGDSAPERWQFGGPNNSESHLLLILYGANEGALASLAARFFDEPIQHYGLAEIFRQDSIRHGPKEPFGFRDGISQPAIEGAPQKVMPGQSVVKAGEFILGYENEYGVLTTIPAVAAQKDAANVLSADPPARTRKQLGRNGSFLVLRKLAQDVEGFWSFIDRETCNSDGSTNAERKMRMAAKFVGRWPSGAPLVLAPDRDNPALGEDVRRNNDFAFVEADPDGYACPIGAHIRRANPRDALLSPPVPGLSTKSTNRHRIIRRGRPYEEPTNGSSGPPGQGLLFVAINSEILRQFELVQQTWINNPKFNGLYHEKDPISGDNDGSGTMTIQAHPLRTRIHGLPRFVTVRGGGYFFLPGISALSFLANLETQQTAARRNGRAAAKIREGTLSDALLDRISKWSDSLLDDLRHQGDPPADDAVKAVFESGDRQAVQALMDKLVRNDRPLPSELPSELSDYFAQTDRIVLPDLPRIVMGERFFSEHGPEIMMVLACYSLPMDYAARKGIQVLYRIGFLNHRPNRRLVETAQMVVDVMKPGGMRPRGDGIRTAQKVRLMHAAIRHLILTDPNSPWDKEQFGVPISQEDRLGTLMSFSWIVIDGLKKLGIVVDDRSAEALLDTWRAVGILLGVLPELLPENMSEAAELTATIARRQHEQSPESREMMSALLEAMRSHLPEAFAGLPAALIRHFLPPAVADYLEVPAASPLSEAGTAVVERLAADFGRIREESHTRYLYRRFSLELMQSILLSGTAGSRAQFAIPETLRNDWGMAPEGQESLLGEHLLSWIGCLKA